MRKNISKNGIFFKKKLVQLKIIYLRVCLHKLNPNKE